MKLIKKIFISVFLLLIIIIGCVYFYLFWLKPQYSGEAQITGLSTQTEVYFDQYGIPHIYATSEHDAYMALGFCHAQERLFQMEMLRRLASGTLAEILGPELLEVDRFFRTLGLKEHADKTTVELMQGNDAPWQKAARAYLQGVNQYIEQGITPLEFNMLGIPKTRFTETDMNLVTGYMSFSFALAFRSDPLHELVLRKFGADYLKDWAIDPPANYLKNPVMGADSLQLNIIRAMSVLAEKAVSIMPVPPFVGSNGWAVAGNRSASGKPIMANDAHIAYAQPGVWYEAHLEAPGLSFYGNHVAGFPFGLIGHNRFASWGLTMLENDDMDFFIEKVNPANSGEVMYKGEWKTMQKRVEIIKVKGGKDDTLIVRNTAHGPVMSGVLKDLAPYKDEVISVWWSYLEFPSRNMEATYTLAHAKSFADSRRGASLIYGPGLNVVYADTAGNIAWWTVSKLVKRAAHVKAGMFLDGSSGLDEPLGYLDFEQNPKSENPANGFIYTANQQPATFMGIDHAGYYCPDDRARRINELLSNDKKWNVEDFKTIQRDVTSGKAMQNAMLFASLLKSSKKINENELSRSVFDILNFWNGGHESDSKGPIVYYKLLYHVLHASIADELGEEEFKIFLNTHTMKNSLEVLLANNDSPWWDDVSTKEKKEDRQYILDFAFEKTVSELKEQLGSDTKKWNWGDVHTMEHIHPIGRKKPFDKLFNVGPFKVAGGNETVSNLGFVMNASGLYKVTFGPSKRIVIDMADPANSFSILPSGQSGVLMSPHYSDQAKMYAGMEYREQMMDEARIKKLSSKLVLKP